MSLRRTWNGFVILLLSVYSDFMLSEWSFYSEKTSHNHGFVQNCSISIADVL